MSGCAPGVVYFFTDAAVAIAARLLALVSGRCATVNRRGKADATVATVCKAGTGTTLEIDVVDCTYTIIERESGDSEYTTIVGITEVDGWVTIGFVSVVCVKQRS